LDIIDLNNNMIGVVEDIIIDYEFNIIAIITSEGFLNKFKFGKKLILIKETILGDENILYLGSNNVKFYSSPHKILEALI
ncbi:MAG: PRC-barrel domain-containing protein, partial [Sarcina sp.]